VDDDRLPSFRTFVSARWGRLLRTAYLLTRDWGQAEDLVQAALVKAWFAWRRIGGDPEPYVRRIIVTTFVSQHRRRRVSEVMTGWLPDTRAPDHGDVYAERDAMWRVLGDLPARQRAVLVLRYYGDLSEAQTAKAMGITVGAVKSQASKALAKLRERAAVRALVPGGTNAD